MKTVMQNFTTEHNLPKNLCTAICTKPIHYSTPKIILVNIACKKVKSGVHWLLLFLAAFWLRKGEMEDDRPDEENN